MTIAQKSLATIAFALILLSLGVADALLTRGTLKLPAQSPAGVAKKAGPDVQAIARTQGFAIAPTTEAFLFARVLPPGAPLSAIVLLRENDRAAAVGWIDSPEVKSILAALKERLRGSFSSRLTDLIDETRSDPGRPPRDVLSFRDPGILPDRVVIVRVRERLYEFHVRAGEEEVIDNLLNTLTE